MQEEKYGIAVQHPTSSSIVASTVETIHVLTRPLARFANLLTKEALQG
jgi:hypothetical protein